MKEVRIICPFCGAEYLPAEIYMPNEFFGKPKDIAKDHNTGRITDWIGHDMNLYEEYRCDKCNTKFKVVADIRFNTSIIDYGDNDDYATKVNKSKITMNEE